MEYQSQYKYLRDKAELEAEVKAKKRKNEMLEAERLESRRLRKELEEVKMQVQKIGLTTKVNDPMANAEVFKFGAAVREIEKKEKAWMGEIAPGLYLEHAKSMG